MGDVVDIADYRAAREHGGWYVAYERCDACGWRGIGVGPLPVPERIECGGCGAMTARAVPEADWRT